MVLKGLLSCGLCLLVFCVIDAAITMPWLGRQILTGVLYIVLIGLVFKTWLEPLFRKVSLEKMALDVGGTLSSI